jgi:hypothetical protein
MADGEEAARIAGDRKREAMIVRAVGTVEIKKFIARLTGLVELRSSCLQLGGYRMGCSK